MSSPAGFVCVHNATKTSCLGDRIQVADRSWDRTVGLLGRQSLEPGAGLFIVPTQAVHTFFMAFAIDLVFINKQFKVVGIKRGLPPWRVSRIFWGAFGVLELPVGAVDDSRTAVGDQLRITDAETGATITS